MRRVVVFVVALSLSACALIATGRAGSSTPRRREGARQQGDWLFVAVLRSDGVVVPFAAYWQGFWLTPWAAPEGYPPDTNTIANQAEAWFAQYEGQTNDWYANGASVDKVVKLRASRTSEVDNHCQKNWGLATDYAAEKYKTNEHHRNVGIAASAPVEIVAPSKLDARARGLAAVVSTIRSAFEEDERARLARPELAPQAKLFPAERSRRARPPVIEALHRVTASGGRRLYYFEAKRRYPKPRGARDAACESVSALSGVLMQSGNEAVPRFVERQFALSDCDGKELSSCGMPLGLIRVGRREFLIVEEHGYEDESYTILEILGKTLRRLRSVDGGSC